MDSFDYQKSSVPARLTPTRGAGLPAQRFNSGEETAPSTISVKSIFRATRRYWWLVLTLWIVGSAALGAGIYLKVKPAYRAFSLLQVEPDAVRLYDGNPGGGNLSVFMPTQVRLISSPNVLQAAAADPKAADLARIRSTPSPVEELSKVIQVSIIPETSLIEVSMTSQSAAESAILVNAVVDSFLKANADWSAGMNKTTVKKLETYYNELKGQSEDMERRLKEMVERSTSGEHVVQLPPAATEKSDGNAERSTPSNTNFTVEHYRKLQSDHFNTKLELITAEAWLDQARKIADDSERDAAGDRAGNDRADISREIDNDPELIELDKQAQKSEQKAAAARKIVKNLKDPAYMKYEAESRKFRELYAMRRQAKLESYQKAAKVNPNGNSPDGEVRKAEQQVATLTSRLRALTEELNKTKIENSKSVTDEVEISLIRDNHKSLKAMQEAVRLKLEQFRFESRGADRIQRINLASVPGGAMSDKRMQYMLAAPFLVLGSVLGLVVLLEIRSGRVADTEVLSSRIRHEVFAIAPLPNIRPGEETTDRSEQKLARFVQSLDHLRVALCEGGVPGEGRCVMITSATGGEGKTTLSAHLAARCANAGTSVLLIDADLRRASLGRLLDVPAGGGLGDVLSGDADLDAALITIQSGGFHFLSAGTPGIDPSRVLKSNRLAELIGQLRQMYDLILIDTPPVLPVADALILGRWADGAVMAARYDASRLPLVERANRQIVAAGIPVLGVVVNGVRTQDQAYGDYNYQYSYMDGREA